MNLIKIFQQNLKEHLRVEVLVETTRTYVIFSFPNPVPMPQLTVLSFVHSVSTSLIGRPHIFTFCVLNRVITALIVVKINDIRERLLLADLMNEA